MRTDHLEQELIITLDRKEIPHFKKFLRTFNVIKLEAECTEQLDCLLEEAPIHKKHFGLNRIETENGMLFFVIKEKEHWYVFLKKNKQFDKLRDLFFKHVPFPDTKR